MWKRWQFYWILLCLCTEGSTQRTELDSPINVMKLRNIRNWIFDIFGRTGTEGGRDIQMARNKHTMQEIVPDNVPFPCNITGGRSQEVPDSIHKLRPGDIDVIAAMGDSLTAGAGIFAHNLLQIFVENRGVGALGGGQGTWRQYLTLPNIIKEFNHNLIGYATGDSLTTHEASHLNVAELGAMSEDMPYMAEVLVKRLKNHPKIDVKKHWKLISFMIGHNDFCSDICWVSSPWSILEKHKTDLLKVLRTLRDNLPRTLVSLIPPVHLKSLIGNQNIGRRSFPKCYLTTNVACSCLFGLRFQSFLPKYYNIMRRWQELDIEISTYPEFQKDDFAVVAQPLTLDLRLPLTSNGYNDMTYFSNDCFHITQKANAQLANSLWNNMLEPIGVKTTYWQNLFEKFLCPTPDRPYFATLINSGRHFQ
ncbi:phospholipase B1, membrane-associated-like [Odontomachus brunneus]|uniref:phospholipase B1, membrane-associated-like n=1 Tax=Odontomachus brunneus TaxID=486640 RepID=UPI0013F19EF2|nr:phospholipase B1, membrane-associated-like [Odontomachus brunneus]XP_032667604.1 phospholipase B1, membrane-associated-like [Odontomachus brunneus]